VLIRGEAGIGKTRLVTDIVEEAKAEGRLVLTGRCIDLVGPGIPYLALSTALFPVRDAYPELSRLTGELDQPSDLQSARLRLLREMRSAIEELAKDRDTVLLIEDLHWADASTLDAVTYLAHSVRRRGVTIIATYRTDGDRTFTTEALADRVAELVRARAVTIVELGPLDHDSIKTLVERAAESSVPASVAEQIVARCGGNPFFAEELISAAAAGTDRLPDVLRHVLLRSITSLPADTLATLEAVAAAGRPVAYSLLCDVTGLPHQQLQVALREATDARVLVCDENTYRFRHALQAEVVASTLLPGRREHLHHSIAQTFEQAVRGGATDITTAEVAEQWARAGNPASALAASVVAARKAVAAAGLEEGLRHLQRVIDFWPAVADAETTAGIDLPSVLTWAAELADLTGHGRRAAQLVRDAIEHLGPGACLKQTGELHERLGTYLLPIGDRQAGLAAFRQAVTSVPNHPPTSARARALVGLGTALMLSYRHADSRDVCERAIDVAERASDETTAARARAVLGLDLCYLGDPPVGQKLLSDARRRALKSATPREVTHSDVLLCDVLVLSGHFDDAVAVARDGLAYADDAGLARGYGLLLAAYGAEALLGLGEWDDAGDLLATALLDDASYWSHFSQLLQAELSMLRGDYDSASRHVDAGKRAAGEPTSSVRYVRVVAELAIWSGRPEEALDAIAAIDPVPDWHAPRLAALAMRAEADAIADRLASAAFDQHVAELPNVGRRLLARVTTEMKRRGSIGDLAEAWRLLAVAEQTRATARDVSGEPEPHAWQAAHQAWTARRNPYLVAYCAWRWVEAELAAGATADATELTTRVRVAATSAERLGADPLLKQIRLLATRTRLGIVGLEPDHAQALARALTLTPREGQVLALVSLGHTNRQIAAELDITAKTASVHVTHVLRKLGVQRRADAGAIAQRVAPNRATSP
jgi:DNA-binding CsgD family transcriptional regulator